MATRTKEGFEELGYTHGTNGAVSRYQATDPSWQAQAYRRGWDRAKSTKTTYTALPRDPGKSVVRQVAIAQAVVTKPKKPASKMTVWFDELKHLPPSQGIELQYVADNAKAWPVGAKEHALFLVKELNDSPPGARRERLGRSLARLQQRHGAAK